MPHDVAISEPRTETVEAVPGVDEPVSATQRRFISPHNLTPRTHLLSNGDYAVMITAAGSGYSRWRDIAVTRWREDVTCDGWGTYVFLRDTAQRRSVVGGLSTERGRTGQLRGRLLGGPGGNHQARRHDHDDAGSGGFVGGRRGGSPRVDHQSRQPNPGNRADLLCRNRVGAARRRRRAPGILEAVRRNGVRCRCRCASGHAAATIVRRRRRPGQRISPSSKARPSAMCSSRPIERASLGGGAAFARRSPWSLARRSPTRSVPCSIRSSASAATFASRRGQPRASRSGR